MSNQVPIAEGLFTWPTANPALLGSRCKTCGVASFPVSDSCMACSGQDVEVEELPGRGTLWTWTVQQFMPKTPYKSNETPETFKPYGVGYLELPGGVQMVRDREGVRVGPLAPETGFGKSPGGLPVILG